jgi:hypothetical protein
MAKGFFNPQDCDSGTELQPSRFAVMHALGGVCQVSLPTKQVIRVPLLVGHVLEHIYIPRCCFTWDHPPSRSPQADNSTTAFKFTGSPMELPHAVDPLRSRQQERSAEVPRVLDLSEPASWDDADRAFVGSSTHRASFPRP